MIKIIEKARPRIIQFLDAYSPLALLLIALPFFLPVEWHLKRTLILLFGAVPAIILTALKPSVILKKPVHLCTLLFMAYFSLQHIRGMLPVTPTLLKQLIRQTLLILGPVILLSRITPERKLYPAVIRLLLFAASLRIGIELFHFYSKAPFPLARFAGMGHPVSASRIMGFMTAMAGAFFLQSGSKTRRWDGFTLVLLPFLLAATLYTHTRSTALALMATAALALFGIKQRMKKTLVLFSIIAVTFCIYATSAFLPLKPEHRIQRPKPAAAESIRTGAEQNTEAFASLERWERKARRKREYDVRKGGVLTTSKGGKACAATRLYIWRDHLSRMTTPQHWLTGHGLGMNVFVKEGIPDPRATRGYTWMPPNGYQLNAHSGYIWALYHGGLIGFGILALLLATAGWSALRAGTAGLLPFALLVFCTTNLLFNSQRLLVCKGPEFLIFWLPLGLAAGFLPIRHQK